MSKLHRRTTVTEEFSQPLQFSEPLKQIAPGSRWKWLSYYYYGEFNWYLVGTIDSVIQGQIPIPGLVDARLGVAGNNLSVLIRNSYGTQEGDIMSFLYGVYTENLIKIIPLVGSNGDITTVEADIMTSITNIATHLTTMQPIIWNTTDTESIYQDYYNLSKQRMVAAREKNWTDIDKLNEDIKSKSNDIADLIALGLK